MVVFLFAQNEAFAAAPAYRASGTFTAGTGAITVPYPASMLANDVCLLAVESENQAISLTTAQGFVQVPTWSPQSAGTPAVNPASRLALYWKRTVGGDAAPVVTDAGDHTTGQIHCFSGVITSGNPWDTGAGDNDGAVNDMTGTIPGATTTSADTMVVLLTSNSRNATSTANCSAWTNASLTGLTERSDNTNTAGLGGGHCMATGIKAAAGPYAATTVALATTSFKGAISLALKPMIAFPTATTMAASGVTTENNGDSWAATLNGMVSSNGADTTVSFEYGTTTAYEGTQETPVPATQSPLAADAVNAAVSAQVIGLNCNTTFHYRVKATNSAGTTNGGDLTFTTGSCPLAPFAATDCAATRFGKDLGCTANDVNLTGITVASGSVSSCVSGTPVTLDIDMRVNFASPDRWDVGIFIANDGKLPTQLPANGGASSCSVDILPITPETGSDIFLNLDGAATIPPDTCGDGNSSLVPILIKDPPTPVGSGVKRMTGVTLPCYATPDSGGKLFVPFVVSWDNQKSPIGGLCTSNQHPVPNTTSKCNAPLSSVPIEVVVLPKISKTHSGATFNPGNTIIYTITVFNDSGGTLQASFFKDPAVANLAVTGLLCTPANGATCPIANNTVADMQGPTGIPIPSANLPNNSSLIFTVTGTLSGSIGTTIDNTATVSIGPNTNTSTDSVTLGSASASKSFAPAAITEDNNSLMTITFTNPTAFDVTGVSFIDTYPSGLVNAASPGESTTCGGTVTPIAGGLTFSGGTIPASGSCTVSVYVTSDTANNYINSVSFTPGSLGSASATLTVNVAVFGAFNACDDAPDPNISCTNTTTPTTSRITTKIAGSPFTLDLVALKTDGSWNSSYSNDVIVELLDASDNSGTPVTPGCLSSWTLIATLGSFPDFGSSNGQITTLTSFTVQEAYRDVRVRVSNYGGVTRVGCSTDNFAIRPNSFAVVPSDDNWTTAGTLRTINNTDATSPGSSTGSPPIHKAGQPFTITATAKNAANATTTNYNVTVVPTAALSACSPGTACTESFGTLALGTPTFSAGAVTWNSATYSEVGAFNLTLQDTNFASVDAADTAASCAGYYVCSAPTAVGRFVPDHFDTAVEPTATIPMPCPTGLIPVCPYDSFVYSGQPFSLTVTAKNASDNPTVNYNITTGLAKTTNLTAGGELGTTTVPTGAGALGVTSVTAFAAGTLTETAEKYTFTTVLPAPTAPTDIYVHAADADGVTSLRVPANTSVEGGVKVVSGRVKIANAYGSELLPLPMTATVQYYNAAGSWVTSLTDSVTNLVLPSVLTSVLPQCKSDCTWTTTPAPASGQVIAGILLFKLSKPSSGGTGSVDVSISAPDYLLTGSNVAGVDPSRPGRATFGVYKGNNQFIYLREMY